MVTYRGSTYKGSASLTLLRKRNTHAVNDHDIALQRRDVTGYELSVNHRHYWGQAVWDIGDNGLLHIFPQILVSLILIISGLFIDVTMTLISLILLPLAVYSIGHL